MLDIIETYDKYRKIGIQNRRITEGTEINLVREYIEYRKDAFKATGNRKMAIFLETKVDNAYPDVVFVEYNPDNYENWNSTRNLLTKQELKILFHVYKSFQISSEDIVTQLGVTWKDTMLSIEKLYDAQLITRDYQGWMLKEEDKISPYKIEAVEAKIGHWDEVLQQSIINKNFASESFALSKGSSLLKPDVLKKFKKFGIGVCVKEKESFNMVKMPLKAQIPVSFNSIFFNEWIGRILNCQEGLVNVS